MDRLLSVLKTIPEYCTVLEQVFNHSSVAVTGIGQINRSHFISGLSAHSDKPIVVITQDDISARRIQQEINSFLQIEAPILPGRELTLHDSAVVSRAWEQRRLHQLHDLQCGNTNIQIMTWESLSQRTIPVSLLKASTFTLNIGQTYYIEDIVNNLDRSGYSRSSMVEGPGQYALRGGILDVFSPAFEMPVRAEFFGDELDTMGFFDPETQRRSQNTDSVLILPVSETQPSLHPNGITGLCKDLEAIISRQRRRKIPNDALINTLSRDLSAYQNNLHITTSDRYMALIYAEFQTALNYIPENASIVICDHNAIRRTAKNHTEEAGMLLDSMLQGGILAGELCDFTLQWEDFCHTLKEKTVVYLDSFGGSSYPEECAPKHLLPIVAKQLPGYGGSLETAAADLAHYQKMDFSCLVLCGSRRRAEVLQQMLNEKGLSCFLCIPLTTMPHPGQILLTDHTLSYGMEYRIYRIRRVSK